MFFFIFFSLMSAWSIALGLAGCNYPGQCSPERASVALFAVVSFPFICIAFGWAIYECARSISACCSIAQRAQELIPSILARIATIMSQKCIMHAAFFISIPANVVWGYQARFCGGGPPMQSLVLTAFFLLGVSWADGSTRSSSFEFSDIANFILGKLEVTDWMTDGFLPGQIQACERGNATFVAQYEEAWSTWPWLEHPQLSTIALVFLSMTFVVQGIVFVAAYCGGDALHVQLHLGMAVAAHRGASSAEALNRAKFFAIFYRGLLEAVPSLFISVAFRR